MPTKGSGRRSWGPPRKVDHRTGSNAAFARAIAAGLPGTRKTTRQGRTSFSVDGARFVAVDDETAVIHADGEDEVRLFAIGRDDLRALIEVAWADFAPTRAATTYRKQRDRWLRLPAVTHDDIRRVVRALPGATEGPIWGNDPGFLIGNEKKTRFARFGPPAAGRVGNLLPHDDHDTLVILHCRQRPELLASSPDRYFTTPHYGDPDEPGGVILRFAEHRGAAALEEIAELLEDAWREVASPDLISQLDG